MKAIVHAPGKVILIGEFAVLEGSPALVAAVDRFARASIRSTDRTHFVISVPAWAISDLPLTLNQQEQVQFLRAEHADISKSLRFLIPALETAAAILRTRSRRIVPCRITLEIGEFFAQPARMKLGIGASAAITVAVLAALLQFNAAGPLDRFELMRYALQAHHAAQGSLGSGVDIAASVFGGILKYRKPAATPSSPVRVDRLSMPPDLHIRCIWTGKAASTRKLVQQVYGFKATNPGAYGDQIHRLARLSEAGCNAFRQKDESTFLALIRRYYHQLMALGRKSHATIVTAEHRLLGEIVHRAGGAYKPSGAGGGDLGLAFSQSASVMQAITAAINNLGFRIIDLRPGAPGVQIKSR